MDINEKINIIKKRVKDLTKHFPYTKEEINYLTVCYLAFIMLDESISDLIDEVLTKVFCIFTDLPIEEAYEIFISNEGKDCSGCNGIYEGYYYYNNKLIYVPYVLISTNCSRLDVFDSLLHELKHALNEVIVKEDSSSFWSGLCSVSKKGFMTNENLDEAFNSYLVGIYLENVSYLSLQNIKDEGIRRILANFYLPENYIYSYDYLVYRSLPLFKNRLLFWALYNASLYKNMIDLNGVLQKLLNVSLREFSFCFDFDRDKLEDLSAYLSTKQLEEAEVFIK